MADQVVGVDVVRFDGQFFATNESKQKHQILTVLTAMGIANSELISTLVVAMLPRLQTPPEIVRMFQSSDGIKYATEAEARVAQGIINARNQVLPNPPRII